jgi:hypothetical protein
MLLVSDTLKGIFFQDLFNGDRVRLGLWVMLVTGRGQADPDVVAGLRRAAGPFLSDSSTMSPGRYAERLS